MKYRILLGVLQAAEDWLVDHDPTRDPLDRKVACVFLCLSAADNVLRCERFVSTGSGSMWCVVREDLSSRDYAHLHIHRVPRRTWPYHELIVTCVDEAARYASPPRHTRAHRGHKN